MKPMVRSRSTVTRSIRDTPGRRLSFISLSLAGPTGGSGSPATYLAGNEKCSRTGLILPKPCRQSRGRGRPRLGSFKTMQKHLRKEKSIVARALKQNRAQTPHHAFDLRTALEWLRSQGDLI